MSCDGMCHDTGKVSQKYHNPSFPKRNSLQQPIKLQQTAPSQRGNKALSFDCLCSLFSLVVTAESLVILVAQELRYLLEISR